jgi:glycosyl transferase family 7 (putative galactosyltransferase)
MGASCILTYQQGSGADGARRANLDAVLARLARSPALEVIVVEQDRIQRLAGALPHPRARCVFVYNDGPFNKGWGFNVGARLAAGGELAFCDADVLVGASLDRALQLCVRDFAVAKPYVRLIDLTRAETRALRDGALAAGAIDASRPGREAIGESIVLCGGLFVIRRDAFAHIGGFDERFVGWGGEDDAMTIKVERARLSCVELDDEVALHLWHPRPRVATLRQPHYAQNLALLQDYRRYADAELARLAEVQGSRGGNAHKYRPPAA